MHIEIPHSLGKDEAIRRIDRVMDDLRSQPLPAGVEIKDFEKAWTDNVLKVGFRAGRGFLGANISAIVIVTDNLVIMDLELPAMLKALVADSQIEEGIKAKITPLLT